MLLKDVELRESNIHQFFFFPAIKGNGGQTPRHLTAIGFPASDPKNDKNPSVSSLRETTMPYDGSLHIFFCIFLRQSPRFLDLCASFFTSVSHQKTFVVKAAEADKTIRGVVFQSTLKKCLAFEIQIMFFFVGGEGVK